MDEDRISSSTAWNKSKMPHGQLPWCDQPFGPLKQNEGGTVYHAYQCRLPEGHGGPHNCFAAEEAGYREKDTRPVKPRGKSVAARVVFG